jgi:hypothetical protein
MEKEQNRNLMIYELNGDIQRQQPQEIYVCRIEGAGTIKDSTCRRWFAKFLNEKEGLKDKNRSGRKSPFYRCGIELLGQRWLEAITNNGEYLV